MVKVIDAGGRNPVIVVDSDEVVAWLRQKADEAGYQDRGTCAIQTSFEDRCTIEPRHDLVVIDHRPPTIALMVSNIPNSRPKE